MSFKSSMLQKYTALLHLTLDLPSVKKKVSLIARSWYKTFNTPIYVKISHVSRDEHQIIDNKFQDNSSPLHSG